MTTSEFVCGTGAWVGSKPGDPDNNIVLNATSTFGGIDVSWSYPATNPHAVAHVVVYRGLTDNFDGAVQRIIVSGNHFFDKFDGAEPVVYYYWIQLVSVNGTYASFVGPASATARPSIEETIRQLSGKIDQGALAQELRADIDHIGLLDNTITGEIQNRIAANQAISLALGSVQGEVATAITLIEEEVTERINANSALLTSLNLMGVGFNNAVAGLTEEIELIATDTSALATKITTVEATVNGNTATGQVGLTAKVNEITGAIQSMYTAKVGVNGLIGGFGLYNDGTSVEAGFDVDTFWVGRTGDDKKKPFIIENDEVFINKAAIQTLSADQIDTRGLSIRDMDGNIIFSAGNPLNYSQITPASGWLNSNLIPSINAAATTASWSGVSGPGKPADGATSGSNLVRKPTFADGSMGAWTATGVSVGDYSNSTSGNFLIFNVRDSFESNNYFSVVPGEVIYVSASITSWQSQYPAGFGLAFYNANGSVFSYTMVAQNPALTGWNRRSGATKVPDGAVKAVPWFQIDGPGGVTHPVVWATEFYIGRVQEGATVGAPVGTYVAGVLAENVESQSGAQLKADSARSAAVTDVTPSINAKLSKAGDTISGRISFAVADGLFAGSDTNNGVYFGSDGLVGRKGGVNTFYINTAGDAVFRGDITASRFMTGGFSGWAWPSSGLGGSYLGPEGLLLGNYNDSKYFQVTSAGNVFAPGMKIENGALTISQANVINTLQIAANAVTVSNSAAGVNPSTTLYVPPNEALTIVAIATCPSAYISTGGSGYSNPYITVTIDGTSFTVDQGAYSPAGGSGSSIMCPATTVTGRKIVYGGSGGRTVTISSNQTNAISVTLIAFGNLR